MEESSFPLICSQLTAAAFISNTLFWGLLQVVEDEIAWCHHPVATDQALTTAVPPLAHCDFVSATS